MKRLLITGAAGGMGTVMRSKLAHMADIIRISHRSPMAVGREGEEFALCDLADRDAVFSAVEGCDGIVHLAGVAAADKFSNIVDGNIVGLYNLYEAARANGMPRILFASSNHTVGFYRQDQRLDAKAAARPDGLYAVSKCFGEALAQMYYDRFGQETAIVRVGSCFDKPRNYRQLATWLSYDDFASLTERVFAVSRLGCPIIWGVSNNAASWWDNSHVAWLGWVPNDSAEAFRAEVEATVPRPDATDPIALYQGGNHVTDPIYEDD
ncbi:NAD-dependent epimerase/dehydratase family protein [Pelagibacterium halotolerans]|uniref:NAD-dependent epimerase/dehydratase family protein n=1 Tax=Pelagibacterium halotolerans TaxID=531813 RepID=UPI00384A779A